MIVNQQEEIIDNSEYKYFVGVNFFSTPRAYFFGLKEEMPLKIGDKVVVETMRGLEMGEISIEPISIDKYENQLGLKPILRVASSIDEKIYAANLKDAKEALEISKTEAEKLHLDMNFISCEYTLDKTKVILSYVADERVDFRELLKVLASRLHTRIELRQIGSRDKSKIIGGIGICGLPLCCATFLPTMEGISINRAKNQMLSLNIPKLSGHCGKLICCLLYEDDTYTELKKDMPRPGETFKKEDKVYKITGMNVLSRVIKIECEEDVEFVNLEDIRPLLRKQNERS